ARILGIGQPTAPLPVTGRFRPRRLQPSRRHPGDLLGPVARTSPPPVRAVRAADAEPEGCQAVSIGQAVVGCDKSGYHPTGHRSPHRPAGMASDKSAHSAALPWWLAALAAVGGIVFVGLPRGTEPPRSKTPTRQPRDEARPKEQPAPASYDPLWVLRDYF